MGVSGTELPHKADRDALKKRLVELLEEGIIALEATPGHAKIGPMIDAIMGTDEPEIPNPRLSRARLNKLGKITLDMRSALTDIKPSWEYRASNKRFEQQATNFGRLSQDWYLRNKIDARFIDGMDYALVSGTGWLHHFWNPDIQDIDVRAEDTRDVIPCRRWDRTTIQNAKGVFVSRERTVGYMHRTYKRDDLVAERGGSSKVSAVSNKIAQLAESLIGERGPWHDLLFGAAQPKAKLPGNTPIIDEFIFYCHDHSVNEESYAVEVGEFIDEKLPSGRTVRTPRYSWCYIAAPGEPLYPRGRCIVFCRQDILEDGPGHFMHGMFPLSEIPMDGFAWGNKSPLWDVHNLQRALDELMRVIADKVRRIGRPGLRYDKNSMARAVANKIDMRKDGVHIAHNATAGKPPEGIYEPTSDMPFLLQWKKDLEDEMDELSGVADLKSLMRLGQIPSTETIDKIIESMTPAIRARSRAMEVMIREFAMMMAANFMQFYKLALRLRILGPSGMTSEDWDYDPGTMVPDFIADADYNADGTVTDEAFRRGPVSLHTRVKDFMRYFSYQVTPGSLLDAASISKKLLYLQLSRMGLIDHWTLLEQYNVPNVGAPPDDATTITKRLMKEAEMGIGVMASTVGRPPTAQAMPSLQMGGGGMPIVSESG